MPKFDLVEFLRVISDLQVQRVYIAPPIAVALAKHPIVDQFDMSCITSCSPAPPRSTASSAEPWPAVWTAR